MPIIIWLIRSEKRIKIYCGCVTIFTKSDNKRTCNTEQFYFQTSFLKNFVHNNNGMWYDMWYVMSVSNMIRNNRKNSLKMWAYVLNFINS